MIKNLIWFVVGAGIGSFVTYNIVEKKLTEELDAEMEEYRARFTIPRNDEPCEDSAVDEEESIPEFDPKQHQIYRNTPKKYKAYDKPGCPDDNDPEDDPYYKEGEKVYREGKEGDPYVISVSDFQNDMPSHDKLTIYYYEYDDTLTDENEDIIDDPIQVVGEDALQCFGEDSEDPDIVYIRNHALGVDYEVIRLPKSYKKTMGIE